MHRQLYTDLNPTEEPSNARMILIAGVALALAWVGFQVFCHSLKHFAG